MHLSLLFAHVHWSASPQLVCACVCATKLHPSAIQCHFSWCPNFNRILRIKATLPLLGAVKKLAVSCLRVRDNGKVTQRIGRIGLQLQVLFIAEMQSTNEAYLGWNLSFFYVLSWRFRTPIIILPKEVPRSSVLSCENVHAPRYRPSEAVAMSSLLFIIVIPKPSNTKPSKPYPLGFETWLAAESHACRWFSHHKPPFRHYPMVFASNKATPSHSQLHFQAKRLQHWDSRSRLWAWHWLSWRPSPESCGSLSTLLRRLQGLSPDIPRDVSSPTSHPQQINTEEVGSCLTHLRAEITTWNVAWGLWIVTDTLRSTDGTFSTWKDWSILVKVACKRIQPYDPAFLTLLDTSGRTSVNCEHQIHIMQPISCHFSGIKNSIPPIKLVWT